MAEYWYLATFVLEKLIQITRTNVAALELDFTNEGFKFRISDMMDASFVRDMMKSSKVWPRPAFQVDLSYKVGALLREWVGTFRDKSLSQRQDQKSMTIIILTDEKWIGTNKEGDISDCIVREMKALYRLSGDRTSKRPISIQFIAFGDDADALKRLKTLANDLKNDHGIDNVDVEEWTGDVYKMLLGSFVEGINWQS